MKELYLIWESFNSTECILVGCLKKGENGYIFEYNIEGALKAKDEGCFLPFHLQKAPYLSTQLFPFFKDRVMADSREELNKYLKKLNVVNYDEFTLLTVTSGKKNSDNFLTVTPNRYEELLQETKRKKLG